MLIIGANGFAKEVLEIFHQKDELNGLAFYDDVNENVNSLFDKFSVLKDASQVEKFFLENGTDFTIAVGNPHLRYKLYEKFISLGGSFKSSISKYARIGSFDVTINHGCNILDNSIISNSAGLGKGCIVYYNVTITHDCKIGDFVELSPGATLLGACEIGAFSEIGANATILPKIKIGKHVIIGAGAVVNKDIPDFSVAVGVPARVIRSIVNV